MNVKEGGRGRGEQSEHSAHFFSPPVMIKMGEAVENGDKYYWYDTWESV